MGRRTLNDPVFGRLRFDVVWTGQLSIPLLANNVAIIVDMSREPGNRERIVFKKLITGLDKVVRDATPLLFKHYNREKIKARYFKGFEGPTEEIPDLAKASDVWSLLSHPGIIVPEQVGRQSKCYISWHCTWDEEHRVQVEITNGDARKVSIA